MEISAEVREYLKLLIELVKAVAWPIFGAVILLHFKTIISNAAARSKGIIFKVAGTEFQFTEMEALDALSEVFNEIDTVLKSHLTSEEKKLLLKILALPESPVVGQVIPNFARDTIEHKMLRALRGVYLIRPVEGGTWQADKHIVVTNFGKIVARHKRDALV